MKINNHKCVYTSNAILRILNQKGGNYGTEVNKSSVLVTPLTLSHRTWLPDVVHMNKHDTMITKQTSMY